MRLLKLNYYKMGKHVWLREIIKRILKKWQEKRILDDWYDAVIVLVHKEGWRQEICKLERYLIIISSIQDETFHPVSWRMYRRGFKQNFDSCLELLFNVYDWYEKHGNINSLLHRLQKQKELVGMKPCVGNSRGALSKSVGRLK